MATLAREFAALWRDRKTISQELERRLQDAKDHENTERESSMRIQRLYRGQSVRARVQRMRDACICITRVFRGFVARGIASARLQAVKEFENLAVFHYHAIALQRTFRGYYSRRYYHDYAARKKYIESVRLKGDELRGKLAEHHEELLFADERRMEEEKDKEFRRLTENLHHLVGTAAVPGIYKSPYAMEVPTVNGVPLEDHLKSGTQELLRTTGYAKRGLVRDLNGSLKIPVKPMKTRLSIQASSKYDAVVQDERIKKKLSKMHFVGPRDFQAGQKVKSGPYRRGLNEGSQYTDPYKNPYLIRGVPQSQAEMSMSRTSLGKAPPKHFYTSVGGNKSTVLPNGLFDVIQDAEASGGVCQRHAAPTARFGVPDTCDVREETIVFPPIAPTGIKG